MPETTERRPSNQEIHEAKLLPPEPKPPRVKSLVEQLHEEWVKLAQTDGRLTAAIANRSEAQYTLNKANASIKMRLRFLQKKAVERIQRRNGIRVIPGHRLPGSPSREDVKKMVDQLAQLAAYHGFELPEDFVIETSGSAQAIYLNPPPDEQRPDASPP